MRSAQLLNKLWTDSAGWMTTQDRLQKTRYTDRWTDRYTDRWTDKCTDNYTDRWTDRYTDRCTDRWIYRYTHRWTDRWTDKWTDSGTDRWTDRVKGAVWSNCFCLPLVRQMRSTTWSVSQNSSWTRKSWMTFMTGWVHLQAGRAGRQVDDVGSVWHHGVGLCCPLLLNINRFWLLMLCFSMMCQTTASSRTCWTSTTSQPEWWPTSWGRLPTKTSNNDEDQ